jgi:hypothetical protein
MTHDDIQKRLVRDAENAHHRGLRHKGLSGAVCEDLLMKQLRRSIHSLRFDRGVIKFGDPDAVGDGIADGAISPQMDVIIYNGRPKSRTFSEVVVPVSQVRVVIEVKKWGSPKMMTETLKRELSRIQEQPKRNSRRSVPLFFVAFRYQERKKGFKSWKVARKQFSTPYAYAFAGTYSHSGKRNLYPWEEKWWKHFGKYDYRGQYERLVKDISRVKSILEEGFRIRDSGTFRSLASAFCLLLSAFCFSDAAVRPRPVDPPARASHSDPEQALQGCSARVVVKRRSACIEATRVWRVTKPELLRVEVVAELVAESAKKRAEGSDLLADGRPHPDAN